MDKNTKPVEVKNKKKQGENTDTPKKSEKKSEKPKKTDTPAAPEKEKKSAETADKSEDKDKSAVTETESKGAVTENGDAETAADGGKSAPAEETVTVKMMIKQVISLISGFLTDCGIPNGLLARLGGLYFLFSAVNIASERKKDKLAIAGWKEFVKDVSFGSLVFRCAIGFILLTALYYGFSKYKIKHADVIDSAMLFTGITAFSCQLLWEADNFYLAMGVLGITGVFIAYSVGRLDHKLLAKIPRYVSIPLILLFTVGVGIFLGITSVSRNRIFSSNCFDMGIFVQMYHSLSDNLTAVTTCERDHFLSHFRVHASYIFYVLAPIYKIFPKGDTLLIAQAVLTVSGVIPLMLIGKRHNFKGLSLIGISLMYLFYSGLIAPNYYEFHENCFLPTLLMWLLYAVDSRKYILFYIMSVLTCTVKEDAPLYVICIGLFLLFDEKSIKRLHGLIMTALSGSYFVFITNWLKENGDGDMMMSTRFGNLTIDADKGFAGIFMNIITDPGYFFSTFMQRRDAGANVPEEMLIFFLEMMVPLLFLPFMTTKIRRFLLMIPFVIMNLVIGSGYGYAVQMGYQYTFGPAALLIYMVILNCADLEDKRKTVLSVAAMYASFVTSFAMYTSNIDRYYTPYKERQDHYDYMDECLESLPEDASIACNGWYLPHAANRKEVYLFDGGDLERIDDRIVGIKDMDRYDYFVLSSNEENLSTIQMYLANAGYTLWGNCDNTILVYKSPTA